MIQPLRAWHRRAAIALAGALPVIFVAGVLARKAPAPGNATITWDANAPAQIRWRAAVPVRLGTRLATARRSDDGTWLEVQARDLLEPDVLVYWSAAAPNGNALPAKSRLLGSIAARTLQLPGGGYAVMYSLARQNVIGSIRLGDLP